MKITALGSLIVVSLLILPSTAEAQMQQGQIGLAIADTVIDAGDTLSMHVTNVDAQSPVFLVLSQTQGSTGMGGITLGVQPPFVFKMVGIAGTTGQLQLEMPFDVIPPGLANEVFHAQIVSTKVTNGPQGPNVNLFASNVETFRFGN